MGAMGYLSQTSTARSLYAITMALAFAGAAGAMKDANAIQIQDNSVQGITQLYDKSSLSSHDTQQGQRDTTTYDDTYLAQHVYGQDGSTAEPSGVYLEELTQTSLPVDSTSENQCRDDCSLDSLLADVKTDKKVKSINPVYKMFGGMCLYFGFVALMHILGSLAEVTGQISRARRGKLI